MYDATLLPDVPGQEAPSAARSGDGPGVDLVEPITLERAKSHLRVVFSDEDDDIAGMITAARQIAEGRLNRTLVQRQLVAAFPCFYGGLALRKPPLISVDSVEYLDIDGNLHAFSDYYLDEFTVPARVELSHGTGPATRARNDAVRVTYTAGYAEGDVPAPIIQWMLLVIGTMYENRATLVNGTISQPLAGDFMQMLIQPFMVYE